MIAAIIQARMSSTRLPGKVLMPLAGRPMIRHIVERVRASGVDEVIVATTREAADDPLVAYLEEERLCGVFRGSEDDVLERYYLSAKEAGAEIVVRVTADDPLKDPDVIDQALGFLAEDPGLDYCSNTLKPTFPEGLDIEAFRFSALEKAHREARLPSDREHVTPYIWKHGDIFRLKNFEHEEDLSSWRWTVDKPQDMEFMRQVFGALWDGDSVLSYRTVIDHLKRHPELMEVNAGTVRNEGYLKSIQDE